MKVILYTDLSIDNYKDFSKIEDGINSRVKISLNFLNFMFKYAKEHNIKYLFFLGDMFEKKKKIDVKLFSLVYSIYEKYQNDFFHIFLIGNHDLPSKFEKYSVNSLLPFSKFGKIIKSITSVKIGNTNFILVPYYYPLKLNEKIPYIASLVNKKKKYNVLLGHFDVSEFTYSGVPLKVFQSLSYNLIFSGHYHNYKVLKNFIFIGSPYETILGEEHTDRGFVVLDTETLKWNLVSFKAPKFYDITIKRESDWNKVREIIKTDFARVILDNPDIIIPNDISGDYRVKIVSSKLFISNEKYNEFLNNSVSVNFPSIKDLILEFLKLKEITSKHKQEMLIDLFNTFIFEDKDIDIELEKLTKEGGLENC